MLRYLFITVFIVSVHVVAIAAMVLTTPKNTLPEVMTVSLIGSMVAPSEPTSVNTPPPEGDGTTPDINNTADSPDLSKTTPERVNPAVEIKTHHRLNHTREKKQKSPNKRVKKQHSPHQTKNNRVAPNPSTNTITGETSQQNETNESAPISAPTSKASHLNNAKPIYPSISRRLKEEGQVIVRVLVSSEGKATQVEIKKTSGYARLDQAALDAVRKWRFIPAKRGQKPIDMWYDVPVQFSLTR